MTPHEKANELFEKMLSTDKVDSYSFVSNNVAKHCALICCDEIIQAMDDVMLPNPFKQYWQKVKQEIINL